MGLGEIFRVVWGPEASFLSAIHPPALFSFDSSVSFLQLRSRDRSISSTSLLLERFTLTSSCRTNTVNNFIGELLLLFRFLIQSNGYILYSSLYISLTLTSSFASCTLLYIVRLSLHSDGATYYCRDETHDNDDEEEEEKERCVAVR